MGSGIELKVPAGVSDDELADFLDTTLKGLTGSPSDDAGKPSEASDKRPWWRPPSVWEAWDEWQNPEKRPEPTDDIKGAFINVGLFALGAVIFVAAIWLPLSRSTVAVDFAKGVVEGATGA